AYRCSQTRPLTPEPPRVYVAWALTTLFLGSSRHFNTDPACRTGVLVRRLLITCSCYRRMSLLRAARSRDRILSVLEETRQRYRFAVVGYVVMPEHIYLLQSEPEVGTPSTVMQVLKQRTARSSWRVACQLFRALSAERVL